VVLRLPVMQIVIGSWLLLTCAPNRGSSTVAAVVRCYASLGTVTCLLILAAHGGSRHQPGSTTRARSRVKILGPTLGFVVAVVAAVICWPLGVLIYCCNR
jgi:hypothetical protein